MNKLNTTFNGGLPLNLNDFRFIDDSVRLALKDIMKSFAGDEACYMYLQSLEVTGETAYHVGEGAIFYQGEIWHIYEHTAEIEGLAYWAFYVSNDPDGNKTFKDGLQHNTYEIRKAVLCALGQEPAGTLYTRSIIQLKPLKEVFIPVKQSFSYTLLNGTTALSGGTPQMVKTARSITIQGRLHCSIAPEGVIILNINSADYRPVLPFNGYFSARTETDDLIMLRYTLGTNGDLTIFTPDQGHGLDIDLCIAYLTANYNV